MDIKKYLFHESAPYIFLGILGALVVIGMIRDKLRRPYYYAAYTSRCPSGMLDLGIGCQSVTGQMYPYGFLEQLRK